MEDHLKGITVFLLSDFTLLLDGLCKIIALETDMRVVGSTGCGEEMEAALVAVRPDVAVVHHLGGDGDVTGAVERIREAAPATRIVVLGADVPMVRVLGMVRTGISAYLLQGTSRQELASAIRSVTADGNRVTVSLPREALQRFDQREPARLTGRETQILVMVAMAMTNGQIASSLALSEASVKRHLRNIFRRLGAVSRIDAVNKARRADILFPAEALEPVRLRAPTWPDLAGAGQAWQSGRPPW
ncbi:MULTISPECIES: LuxR C-terminal-related transcriptional regulator [unclassified Streptomyces]|uniref:LuxR C-terminal-related transcriptional regulator n=1 Tax=unclassified Streptomyces TaxID=2593676 RepID=UPI0036C32D6C